jgi:hypothetical protein
MKNKYAFLDFNYIHHDSYIQNNYRRKNKIYTFERIKDYATFGIFFRKINHDQNK